MKLKLLNRLFEAGIFRPFLVTNERRSPLSVINNKLYCNY